MPAATSVHGKKKKVFFTHIHGFDLRVSL